MSSSEDEVMRIKLARRHAAAALRLAMNEAQAHHQLVAEMAATGHPLGDGGAADDAPGSELEELKQRYTTELNRGGRALVAARRRLEEIDASAHRAEARAERAERLAGERAEYTQQRGRLRELMKEMDAADCRAQVAEERALAALEETVDAAS